MGTARWAQTAPSAESRQRVAGPPIVALVCSAGGLQALISVLRPLPADFPAVVIALQHQSPDKPSYLADILARDCLLPVSTARQGAVLRAGTAVDHVLPVGEIPALLVSLTQSANRPATALPRRGVADVARAGGVR